MADKEEQLTIGASKFESTTGPVGADESFIPGISHRNEYASIGHAPRDSFIKLLSQCVSGHRPQSALCCADVQRQSGVHHGSLAR